MKKLQQNILRVEILILGDLDPVGSCQVEVAAFGVQLLIFSKEERFAHVLRLLYTFRDEGNQGRRRTELGEALDLLTRAEGGG